MRAFAFVVVVLIGIFSGLWALGVSVIGKSAIHEILGAVYLLITVICIAAAGLLAGVEEMIRRLPKPRPTQPPVTKT